MNRRVVIVGVAIGALCALLVAYNFLGALLFSGGAGFMQPPPTPVEAVTVEPGPWEPGLEAVGTARAAQGADIAAEVAGRIKAIKFKPNTRAKAGELLVQIDDAVERSDLTAANANMRLYAAQLQRSQTLVGKGFVSRASLDTVQAQLGVAQSARERALAIIDQKSIEAPFSGTLGIARVDVGQYVAVGTVVVTLQDLDRMKVDFTIPEQVATSLKPDQPVRFGIEKSVLNYNGRILGIDPKADPDSRLVAVQAQIDDAKDQIRSGQFVNVRVDLPTEQNVISLPQTAVMPSLYGDYVFAVGPPDPPAQGDATHAAAAPAPAGAAPQTVAKQVFITTGRRDGRRVEVLKGLKKGDIVVASGQNRLQNGAPVQITAPTRPSTEKSAPATEPAK
jgi:membrane fusion protein (multidrug efflux system)